EDLGVGPVFFAQPIVGVVAVGVGDGDGAAAAGHRGGPEDVALLAVGDQHQVVGGKAAGIAGNLDIGVLGGHVAGQIGAGPGVAHPQYIGARPMAESRGGRPARALVVDRQGVGGAGKTREVLGDDPRRVLVEAAAAGKAAAPDIESDQRQNHARLVLYRRRLGLIADNAAAGA